MFDRKIFLLDGSRSTVVLCVMASVVYAACVIGQALSMSSAIVGAWNGVQLGDLAGFVAIFAACFVGRQAVRSLQESRMEKYAHRVTSSLHERLMGNIYENSATLIPAYGTAAIVSEATDGAQRIERYISIVLPRTIAMFVVPLCIAIAVFTQDVVSGLIVVVCYPFIIAFMKLIGRTASDESAVRHDGFIAMSNHFLDALRGMRTLRAFGISRAYSKNVKAASERYRKLVMRTLRIAQLSGAVLDLFATCGLAAVAIMLGFRMVEGSLAFFPALVVLMLVPEYFLPIRAYASDYHASLDGKNAFAAMIDMCDVPRRMVDFSSVSECIVRRGESVAIIGPSGSGKTTLLDAVAGLIDSDGLKFVVCGVGSDGFKSLDWQKRIAYIPQHPHIFAGTLRENIAFYNVEASDVEIEKALFAVGLGCLFDQLECGLDTRIGYGGRSLSGGEAHRVALARALVDDARDVWLLDEPGSSLDVMTERDLKASILPLMEGRTVIIATHRKHWLKDVDQVVDLTSQLSFASSRGVKSSDGDQDD